jgi:hypothetical protein
VTTTHKWVRGTQLSITDIALLLTRIEAFITPEQRLQLMADVPGPYNRWMGEEIVTVHDIDGVPLKEYKGKAP